MSDEWAARLQDPLIHTSWLGELVSWATEAVIYGAAAFFATCLIACPIVAFGVGLIAGAVIGTAAQSTEMGKKVTEIADWVGNSVSPPQEMGFISTASKDTRTNSKFSARAAGKKVADVPKPVQNGPSVWEALGNTLNGMTPWGIVKGFIDRAKNIANPPVVQAADPGTEPANEDCVFCERHTNDSFQYMVYSVFDAFTGNNVADEFSKTAQYIAQGSEEVNINGQPSGRSNMKTTCEGTINENYAANKISPDVRIGGETITVRDITSGKNKWVQLATLVFDVVLLVYGAKKALGGCGKGNPVMISSGAKMLQGAEDIDFQLAGLLPVVWSRIYCSTTYRDDTLLGLGWSLPYEAEIRRIPHPEEEGELWLYYDATGNQIELGNLTQGSHVFIKDEKLCICQITDTLTVIEDINKRLLFVFDKDPYNAQRSRLLRLSDVNGNHLNLTYDDENRLDRIADEQQHLVIQLHYDKQHTRRLRKVERLYLQPTDQTILDRELLVSYELTENGDLKTVKNAENTVLRTFTYNDARKMASHTLPTGSTRYYEWAVYNVPTERQPKTLKAPQQSEEWRVIHHWMDEGEEYFFDYDLAQGKTKITDSLGRIEHYEWDEYYHIYKQADAMGNEWLTEWREGLVTQEIDPQGNISRYQYNDNGYEVEATDPLGRTRYTSYKNHKGLPSKVTDFTGNTWYYHYDKAGNLIEVVNPLKQTTQYEYDIRGLTTQITDESGKQKTLNWNRLGQLVQYRDCSGYSTVYNYDKRGFLAQVINELNQTTTYHYNLTGFLTQITLADQRVIRYQRNQIGFTTGYIDPAQNMTQYKYNISGRISQRIDGQGRTVAYHYDDYGRLIILTNENNENYRFEWDDLDRLITQHELDGGARRYHYNSLDQVIRVDYIAAPTVEDPRRLKAANDDSKPSHSQNEEQPLIISHHFERDAIGRLIKKITDDGITEYTYDKNNNLLAVIFTDTQGKQQALTYSYDELNQLQTELNNLGTLTYQYDELGNLEQFTLPDGRNLNHLYYGSGYLHQINLDGQIIADFERDRLHQEILRTQGQLNTYTKYDATGRLTQRQISQFRQKHKHALPLLEKSYQYDAADNLIAEHFTQYQRPPEQNQALADQLGKKLPLEPHGLQQTESPAKNSPFIIGRLFAQNAANTTGTERSEVQLNISQNSYQATRYYNYDSTGRILQSYQNTPQGRGLNYETIHYDAAANLLNGDTSQGYVKHNRVQVYQDKRYYYDRFGRLAEKRIGGHTVQHFTYDAEHRITEIKHTQHAQTKYIRFKYDPIGRRIEKATYLTRDSETPIAKTEFYWQGMRLLGEKQNGITSYYIYDNGYKPLARIEGTPGKEKISYFHNNLAGLPEQLTDSQGNSIWQAEYKIWGNAEKEWKESRSNFDQNLRYQGQYLDRETGLHHNTFRYFDPDIGRFTQPDPIGLLGGNNLYQYAPNPISWIDPWGLSKCSQSDNKSSEVNNKSFREMMTPEEAKAYDKYWTRHAPEASSPYNTHVRYTENGDIKQVTTYDKYGDRHRQYDFIDSRRAEHQHNFDYSSGNRPKGTRSDHLPIDE